MMGIVDYGLGNIHAFADIYKRLNIPAEIVSTPRDLRRADRIILPGVGAFDWAVTRLNRSGLREALDEMVVGLGRPVLGVCVGMQIMADRSDEGELGGLGWIAAEVKKFDHGRFAQKTHLPHMGWNDARPRAREGLFAGFGPEARFYFLHSYYFVPRDPEQVLAVTDYGGPFASGVCRGNIFGVQFHPEKSHRCGVRLLENFARL